MIYQRTQTLFKFRNLKQATVKRVRRRRADQGGVAVAMGQYFFPFTMQLPTHGPNGEELPSSYSLNVKETESKNNKEVTKEFKYGIKWTISFSFDPKFGNSSVLELRKPLNLIFDPKPSTVEVDNYSI